MNKHMKRALLISVIKRVGWRPLLIAGTFVLVITVTAAGAVAYGAYSLAKEASSRVSLPAGDITAQGKALLQTGLDRPLTTEACLGTITGLVFQPTRWLTNSVSANLRSLESSCLKQEGKEEKPAKT